jgi:dephospho-CoA kinase
VISINGVLKGDGMDAAYISGKQTKIIGLTGQYCAGKNHVAALLERRGIEVLDVDKLGHRALEEEKVAITSLCGASILAADGTIDRKALGNRVFGSPDLLKALEAIVHPAVNRMTDAWIEKKKHTDIAINAALLHRSSAVESLSFVMVVRAPYAIRFLRALRRDRATFTALIKRFSSQKNFSSQYFFGNADMYIVDNPSLFGLRAESHALERRIDSILAREGMVQ